MTKTYILTEFNKKWFIDTNAPGINLKATNLDLASDTLSCLMMVNISGNPPRNDKVTEQIREIDPIFKCDMTLAQQTSVLRATHCLLMVNISAKLFLNSPINDL